MRKLATIRKVSEIAPIIGADKICHYRVDGWWIVDSVGRYQVNDLAIYIEIDAWCPHELAPFLSKGKEPREYNGVKGERLKTVKLRGAVSQGLLLPIQTGIGGYPFIKNSVGEHIVVQEGMDVTELLGVQKWEPPIPAQLRGKIAGNFPSWLRKTDEDRIQNCFKDVSPRLNESWVIEEKVDGSSMTVGYRKCDFILDKDGQPIPEEFVVCSRNLSLKLEDEDNTFVRIAKESSIQDAMKSYGRNLGISGELIGEGIQGNKYDIKGHRWLVFNIFDVDTGKYVSAEERQFIIRDLVALGATIEQVPVITAVGTTQLDGLSVDDFLEMAEGKSVLNPKTEREGLVFKNQTDPDISFKAISNRWLLKTGE